MTTSQPISRRPWVPADDGASWTISDISIDPTLDGAAIYVGLYSSLDYLSGKTSQGAVVDQSHAPGYTLRQLTVRNVVLRNIRRQNVPDSHCDALSVGATGEPPPFWTDLVDLDGIDIDNCDGATMLAKVENVRIRTLRIANWKLGQNIAQRRFVLKPDAFVQTLRIENCKDFRVDAPSPWQGQVGRVELVNSTVDVSSFPANIIVNISVTQPPKPPAPTPGQMGDVTKLIVMRGVNPAIERISDANGKTVLTLDGFTYKFQ